jgi:hypothetical protein
MPNADHPVARTEDLLIEEVGGELLVFDLQRDTAHALNEPATKVWRLCDGSRTMPELARDSGLTEDAIRLAIVELEEKSLLATPAPAGVSRRRLLETGVLAGAGLGLGYPVIRSIVAPTSAMASSTPGPTGPTGD